MKFDVALHHVLVVLSDFRVVMKRLYYYSIQNYIAFVSH